MSTPGFVEIWSLDIPSIGEAAINFDVWAVNHTLIYRAGANNMAFHLNTIPRSETRLRDEGIIPLYACMRNISNTLKSSARELGVSVPDIPSAPEDWNDEASTDSQALATEIRPRLAEPVRASMDWIFGSRDRSPRLHWTSRVAVTSVALDLLTRAAIAIGGMMEGSGWEPYVAQMTSDELKWITGVIKEELLRIRAQPGSGWDEEEAKRVVTDQLGVMKEIMAIGT